MNNSGAALFAYDDALQGEFPVLCGCDEAGRGPLCGPVFAAAVVFAPGTCIEGLNDSKKLSPGKRTELFRQITELALCWSVNYADVECIEAQNILNASLLAMRGAVDALPMRPDLVLVDGNRVRFFENLNARPLVKGDALSAAVAAASVLAKVSRDRYLEQMDFFLPGYGFAQHKGYPTKAHYEAIARLGVSPYHRPSFLKKRH